MAVAEKRQSRASETPETRQARLEAERLARANAAEARKAALNAKKEKVATKIQAAFRGRSERQQLRQQAYNDGRRLHTRTQPSTRISQEYGRIYG